MTVAQEKLNALKETQSSLAQELMDEKWQCSETFHDNAVKDAITQSGIQNQTLASTLMSLVSNAVITPNNSNEFLEIWDIVQFSEWSKEHVFQIGGLWSYLVWKINVDWKDIKRAWYHIDLVQNFLGKVSGDTVENKVHWVPRKFTIGKILKNIWNNIFKEL